MPSRAEPGLVLAPPEHVGADPHLVAFDRAFERAVFVNRDSGAAVAARPVLVEMQERAQPRPSPPVGRYDIDPPFRIRDFFRRDHTGLAEGELIRPLAH